MRSLTFPGSVVASDAMPLTWTAPPADPLAWPLPPTAITHPRTAGTFCRALRLLTRDAPDGAGRASLAQVLARCSLEPARLLEGWVPAMRGKGRLQPGRDADVVVFDPETVTDQASYADSTRPVGRHPACPGQRRFRGARRRHHARTPGRGARCGPEPR